jgi:mono/diheme cytochrome c family protein
MITQRSTAHPTMGPRRWPGVVAMIVPVFSIAVIAVSPPGTSALDDRGRDTFIAKGCAGCHAVYGHGVGGTHPSGGPDLGEHRVYGTHLELAARMWNHLPKMLKQMDRRGVRPPEFTTEEVDLVIRYLAFIRYMDQPGNERTGRRLLNGKRCTRCHGLGSEESKLAPNLAQTGTYTSPLDLATALWNHGPDMQELFEEQDIDRPTLSRHDIVDLAAGIRSFIYTSTVPPEAYEPGDPVLGAQLARDKGCLNCHAVRGSGGNLAPDFGELEFRKTVTEIAGTMWNHGPEMWELIRERGMAFPSLEREEMAAVIAYLYSLALEDEPGDAASGASKVQDKRCTTCHTVSGVGGDLAEDLTAARGFESPTAMIAAMWNHASDMADYGRERRIRWPKLSADDIADIYAFVRSH